MSEMIRPDNLKSSKIASGEIGGRKESPEDARRVQEIERIWKAAANEGDAWEEKFRSLPIMEEARDEERPEIMEADAKSAAYAAIRGIFARASQIADSKERLRSIRLELVNEAARLATQQSEAAVIKRHVISDVKKELGDVL